ncbi:MAG TPA: hypothetical protein VK105_00170 [Virgibacillus sp.]|nr:hypothetical protein [Virgibacillus sp.]HLR65537.1 hypothetical protein [Virgibacillus sp.]
MSHSKKKDTSNQMLYDADWFKERMFKTFGKILSVDDVSYESILFERDEIDEAIIAREHLNQLPTPLLTQTYMFVDENAVEWLLLIVIDEHDGKLLFETWMKNGKVVLTNQDDKKGIY